MTDIRAIIQNEIKAPRLKKFEGKIKGYQSGNRREGRYWQHFAD